MRESKEEKRRATARDVVKRIEEETGQCADPLKFLLLVMTDTEQPFENRVECAKASIPYVHPKLANVQHTGPDGAPLELRAVHEIMMDPALAALAEQLSFALVSQQNKLETVNPLLTIDVQRSPDDEQPELLSLDPRPIDLIEASGDEQLSYPVASPDEVLPGDAAALRTLNDLLPEYFK